MKTLSLSLAAIAFLVAWPTDSHCAPPEHPVDLKELRAKANKLENEGNRHESLELWTKLILDSGDSGKDLADDCTNAVNCMRNLGRWDLFDSLLEKALAIHPNDRLFLAAAGRAFTGIYSNGVVINNTFRRGYGQQSGRFVHCGEQDHLQSLQLEARALALLQADKSVPSEEARDFYLSFAQIIQQGSPTQLLTLSDLKKKPDYLESMNSGPSPYLRRGIYLRGGSPTPIGDDGLPIYHQLPASWEAATTDGERWRWLLAQASKCDATGDAEAKLAVANFMRLQIGENTLPPAVDRTGERGGITPDQLRKELQGLKDDEALAWLGNNVKRFHPPDEFNPLKIYLLVGDSRVSQTLSAKAWTSAAQILENRFQLERAAGLFRRVVNEAPMESWLDTAKQQLSQITGNWGEFDVSETQLAGKEPSVGFTFRNGKSVQVVARPIVISDLITDIKNYLRNNPNELDYSKLNIEHICSQFINHEKEKYLQKPVATWTQALEPASDHWEKKIDLKIPVRAAGAYWVEAHMENGNRFGTVVWLQDTLLVRKPMEDGVMYLVVDAATGAPVEGATVEMFGYRAHVMNVRGAQRPHWEIKVQDAAEFTNADGIVKQPPPPKDAEYFQWMGVATTKQGRLAVLGFNYSVPTHWQSDPAQMVKNYLVTDRPVYRPKQDVQFKIWRARANYAQEGANPEAGAKVSVEIKDPRGQTVLKNAYTLDASGGLADKLTLADNAPLGEYMVLLKNERPGRRLQETAGSFRVEEYKKPEFEVTVEAPQEPITLGGKATATVHARYYFGGPVAQGTVHYKVLRSAAYDRWYPVGPWDWLYGNGYGWFAPDTLWYPGWGVWGCLAPHWSWIQWHNAPPELVLEGDAKLDADGVYKIEIDTAKAKEYHGDTNHVYSITAEVTDASRREITGSGQVTAARAPFKVYLSLDRGYYDVGQGMEATIHAFTADKKPVEGQGKVRLLAITYDVEGKPTEKQVSEWDLRTDADGKATQKLSASEPGQYRLACAITDAQGRTEEGAQLLVIRGPGFDGRKFRFNALELIPDRREYAPGDELKLLVNTEQADSFVVLFERASGFACKEPRYLHLAGKSQVVSLKITPGDEPNRFVEAITVSGGTVHQIVREIATPPQKRVLNLALEAPERSKPHQKATIKLKLTDEQGNPCAGDMVLTMYDKALEYISGGSNVPDIKRFFWGWKRQYYPNAPDASQRWFGNFVATGETPMQPLGLWWVDYPNGRSSGRNTWGLGRSYLHSASLGAMGGSAGYPMEFPAAPMSAAFATKESQLDNEMLPQAMDKDARVLKAARVTANGSVARANAAGEGSPEFAPPPMVRVQFADTAVWVASIKAKDDGVAEVPVDLPDNLTTWKLRAWALGNGTKVAESSRELTTTKDLLVRLQAPRFFVEQDEVTLSANVHNYLATPQQVRVKLELGTDALAFKEADKATQMAQLNPKGEARIDWRVKVVHEGEAKIKVEAVGQDDADAMELTLPVHVHGMLRTESWSLAMKQDQASGKIEFTVPEKRRAEQTVLEVRSSPSLAAALVEALPYLADYPYGCTEQTLNRFLPSALTREVLLKEHIKLGDLAKLPRDQAPPDARKNPIYDDKTLDKMVRTGLERLMNMQNTDGGWGWFFGSQEHSYAHTTATVVHGLLLAERAHLALPPDVLRRGVAWLKKSQAAELAKLRNAANHVEPWKDHVSEEDAQVFAVLTEAGEWDKEMGVYLFNQREPLSVYSKSLLGLAFDRFGQVEQRDMLLRNVEQFLEVDAENQSAHLRLPSAGYWWHWYGSDVETTATYLRLLCKTKPHSDTAAGIAKYLVNHRRHGSWWNSTRDTALSVEALAEYLTASGEGDAALNTEVEVWLDGKKRHEVTFTRDTLFAGKDRLEIRGEELTAGKHTLEIRKKGDSRLYVNASVSAFTLEDNIPAAGLEVKVTRHYWKLTPKDVKVLNASTRGLPLEERKEAYERTEIKDGDEVKSGDLIEAELIAESKNDYEYILVEDMKASGFEPVEVRSGYVYMGHALSAYLELHDERAAFFLRELPLGTHALNYRLRAETPGVFHVLPTKISAMYAPDLRGNSAELHVRVVDATKPGS